MNNKTKCKYLGTPYGGFPVILEMLDCNSVIFDFGVGEDVSFSEELIKATQCNIELFDFTPTSIEWYKNNINNSNMNYNEYGLSNHTGELKVHSTGDGISRRPAWMGWEHNETYHVKTLSDIMIEKNVNHIDLLKIDIEGEEYSVIPNMIDSKIFPIQICMEFHSRMLNSNTIGVHDIVSKQLLVYYDVVGYSGHDICLLKKGNINDN